MDSISPDILGNGISLFTFDNLLGHWDKIFSCWERATPCCVQREPSEPWLIESYVEKHHRGCRWAAAPPSTGWLWQAPLWNYFDAPVPYFPRFHRLIFLATQEKVSQQAQSTRTNGIATTSRSKTRSRGVVYLLCSKDANTNWRVTWTRGTIHNLDASQIYESAR